MNNKLKDVLRFLEINFVENEHGQNTYVVELEQGCIVIDAGCSVEKISQITNKPIKAVFITHGHYDHIQNIEEYDKLNVPIYASEHLSAALQDSDSNGSYLFNNRTTYKVKNIHSVTDGKQIEIDNLTITCIQTKGHTKDGYCFLVKYKTEQVLFSGDTLFALGIGRTDLKTASAKELMDSLNKLQNLEYNLLLPGHSESSTSTEQKNLIPKWIRYIQLTNREL